MSYRTLVDAAILNHHLNDPKWIIIDCRFSLSDAQAGAKAYRFGHIPNARYANLNTDLSAPVTSQTGRHPLPNPIHLAQRLGRWGISNDSQVVVYDDMGGAFAGRLWYLLRWLGHPDVAVLNGGLQYWKSQNYPLTTVLPKVVTKNFRPYLDSSLMLQAPEVQDLLAQNTICLLDARACVRYCGQQEPIDPVAGHIPKALNRPQTANLDAQQRFRPANELRMDFLKLLNGKRAEQTVHMCGSGVTACHNLLAMEYAGLQGSKLYAGSWSEWIRNKNRPLTRC